jgi:formylglycine-generating enzyme required for sulfatase activity
VAETEDRTIRLASIVAIDIVGFSTMSERDQRNAARKVEALRARIIEVAGKNGGRLFNTAGDGFMLEFTSAGSALGAIQDLLDRRPKGEPPVRVGAHVGDVVVTATDDLLGHGVNVAARLQELAHAGSALVSAEFRSMARSSPTVAFQSRGQKPLDNIEQRVETFEILSKQQRFARSARRTLTLAVLALVLGVGAFFGPMAWRMVDARLNPETPASALLADGGSAPDAVSPTQANDTVFVAGHTFRDCDNCPEFVVLPGGVFMMGSPDSETGRRRDEGPQHEVSISPFAISRYEVTFAQWDACLAGGGCNGYSPSDGGVGRGERPVSNVSWNDAQAYLDWLNAHAGGLRYRLLTEAEWEYAARAGASEAYAFGPRVTAVDATFRVRAPTPVGAHEANAWGVFDMHGNVAEWVEDCYAPNYDVAPLDGGALQAERCARRVYRGGAFADQAALLRASSRQSAPADRRSTSIGFRLARTLD